MTTLNNNTKNATTNNLVYVQSKENQAHFYPSDVIAYMGEKMAYEFLGSYRHAVEYIDGVLYAFNCHNLGELASNFKHDKFSA